MIRIKNPASGEERMINKVLGDKVTLAKAEDRAGYYDMENNQFIPRLNETHELIGFVTHSDHAVLWEIVR
ncbi:hypothetical protein B9T29_15305 [Acinetobacter sp. ANC 3903]|uniref:hypothetical protein n=1 Tax=Acinetobacter sp. ANC 3903 TaxID=1977883 RepID=UPI000A354AD2|nr:hypothetical protein [Acinetobacter sp. ANC 3903]OTG57043.1 hypothetical protein B9T29_15305 [Acinetobacter sp. ANC 3903]